MITDGIKTVLNRNIFHRDGYRLLLRLSIIQGLVIILLAVGVMGLLFTVQTKQVYFVTTTDGRIIPVVPLGDRYRSDAEVLAWATKITQDALRFSYQDYETHLKDVQNNFTSTGWEDFTNKLKSLHVLDAIAARKLTLTADIAGAPQIDRQEERDGIYHWVILFPVTVRFDGTDAPGALNLNLGLDIVRVSTLDHPQGIKIQRWIAK